MKHNKLLIVGILALPILLSACDGGSSSSPNTATTINGITVPPAPDPATNNATLAGVDSNNNGVRDDVERKIAEKIDINNFNIALKYAAAHEAMIISTTPTSRADAIALISKENCATLSASSSVRDLNFGEMYLTTAERKIAQQKFNNILVSISPEEILPCN
jgi:hypothetical protein